eukprot:403333228
MQPNFAALQNCFKYVSYGNTQGLVNEQASYMLTKYPQFMPTVEQLEFPGEIRQNYLVLKGTISCQSGGQNHNFPVKIILQQGFPFHPPRVFLDMQISLQLLQKKTYLGQMNAFKIPYLNNWQSSMQQKPNLTDLLGFISSILSSDPPVEQGLSAAMMGGQGQQNFPQQQVAQPMPYNNYQQQQYQNNVGGSFQDQYNYGSAPISQSNSNPVPSSGIEENSNFELIEKIDKLSKRYTEKSQETLNKLVESKVQLHQNKRIIEEQLENLKSNCGTIDQNIQQLNNHSMRLQQFVSEQGASQDVNEDNIGNLIYPKDAYSAKIVEYVSKENALEDCLIALKKAFEKEQLSFPDFIKSVREISRRQFKAQFKRNKLVYALSLGASASMNNTFQGVKC